MRLAHTPTRELIPTDRRKKEDGSKEKSEREKINE